MKVLPRLGVSFSNENKLGRQWQSSLPLNSAWDDRNFSINVRLEVDPKKKKKKKNRAHFKTRPPAFGQGRVKSSCYPATFSHTNPLSISKIQTVTKFFIPMLQTSNLAVLLIFSCSFYFWYSQSARPLAAKDLFMWRERWREQIQGNLSWDIQAVSSVKNSLHP